MYLGYKIDLDYLLRLCLRGKKHTPTWFDVAFTSPPALSPKEESGLATPKPGSSDYLPALDRRPLPSPSIPSIRFDFNQDTIGKNSNSLPRPSNSGSGGSKSIDAAFEEILGTGSTGFPGSSSRKMSTMEIDIPDMSALLGEETTFNKVNFAYMRWIFPYLAALHSRDKALMKAALNGLEELFTEGVIVSYTFAYLTSCAISDS